MQKIKIALITLITICTFINGYAQKTSKTSVKDFSRLVGNWQGSLTYLDYSSGKPYTMPADMEINRIEGTNQFIFSNIYPNERHANSADTVTISKNGKWIDEASVKSRKTLKSGELVVVTEEKGTDGNDNKPAVFRHTYTIGKSTYSKKKEVRFDGETQWIKRHEYAYTRKSGK